MLIRVNRVWQTHFRIGSTARPVFLRLTRRVRFAHLQDVGRNNVSAQCWNHSANGADPGKQTTSDDRGFAACRASGGRFAPKTLVLMPGEAQFSALAPTSRA